MKKGRGQENIFWGSVQSDANKEKRQEYLARTLVRLNMKW